jgi:hypothetical protein
VKAANRQDGAKTHDRRSTSATMSSITKLRYASSGALRRVGGALASGIVTSIFAAIFDWTDMAIGSPVEIAPSIRRKTGKG